ncbi:MAG: hypothetical protein ABIJ92_05470 [Candidatus Aenigmatarchaeota archaeon]
MKIMKKDVLLFVIGFSLLFSSVTYSFVDTSISLDHFLIAVIFFIGAIFIQAFKDVKYIR